MKKLTETEKLLHRLSEEKELSAYAVSVGYGEDEYRIFSDGVNAETYFDAASVGKVFPTSVLALKLIDENRLSLDDTLGKFFPEIPSDKKNITVKQLMTHTSGMIRKEFPENIAENGRKGISDFIFGVPLAYEPGTHYAYCCNGMIILAFIAEKIYETGLDEAFEEKICRPLGLTRSRYFIRPDEPNAVNCNTNPAVNDIRPDDGNVKKMNGIPAGSGGLYTSAGDLTEFAKAIIACDGRLYGKKTFELAERNYTAGLPVLDKFRGSENHGLGFTYVNEKCTQAYGLFGDGAIGHDGWTGQSFYLERRRNLYAVIMTDASRCCAVKKGFVDYDRICSVRAEIHSAVKYDLGI